MEVDKEDPVGNESKVVETISGTESTTKESDENVDPSSAENKLTSTTVSKLKEKDPSENAGDTGGSNDVSTTNMCSSNTGVGFKLPQLPVALLGKMSKKRVPKSDPVSVASDIHSEATALKTTDKSKQEGISPGSQNSSSDQSTKDSETTSAAALTDQTQTDKKDVEIAESQSAVHLLPLNKDVKMKEDKSSSSADKEVGFAAPLLPPKHSKIRGPMKPPRDPSTNTSSPGTALRPDEDPLPPSVSSTNESTSSKQRTHSSISKLSPAEKIAQAVPIPYKEPSWAGVPKQPYHLEVLKGGAIISTLSLNEKSFLVFGRLESCDVMLEHPSLSRFHMVLQYRLIGDSDNDPGFYAYDLDSTHGSFLNKKKLKPKTYCRMMVGHMFKLAGSTRLYVLQGPAEDQEADSGLSIAELKYLRGKQLAEREQRKIKEKEEEEEKQKQEEEAKGISWGMDDDDAAEEEEDPSEVNPFALMTQEERESLYIKDPKKTLRGFFEREGFELEYDVDEKGIGHTRQYICRVELPIDDADGHPIIAEAAVGGKKKEAVVACALEACRILDAQGVLRQAKHESKKRKAKNWADDDYYDSDDDTFLDRTGEIEKKRKARMKKAGVLKDEVETFASLTAKMARVEAEIKQIDDEITTINNTSAQTPTDDSLDAFMSSIKSGTVVDKTRRAKLKIHKIELKKEQARLMKLINIARPVALPEIKRKTDSLKSPSSSSSALTKKLPMIGSIKGRLGAKKFKFVMPVAKPVVHQVVSSTTDDMVEEEEDEEDEEDVSGVPMETTTDVHQDDKIKDLPGPSGDVASDSSLGDVRVQQQTDEKKDITTQQDDPSRQQRAPVKGPQRPSQKVLTKGPQKAPSKGPSKSDFQQYLGSFDDEHEDAAVTKKKPSKVVAMETDEDAIDWVPPKGQTGDGRTSLNDKFGY